MNLVEDGKTITVEELRQMPKKERNEILKRIQCAPGVIVVPERIYCK